MIAHDFHVVDDHIDLCILGYDFTVSQEAIQIDTRTGTVKWKKDDITAHLLSKQTQRRCYLTLTHDVYIGPREQRTV